MFQTEPLMKATQGYYVFLAGTSFSANSISRYQAWAGFRAQHWQDLTSVDFEQARGYFCMAETMPGEDIQDGSR